MICFSDIPVDPDRTTAQQWAHDELTKQVYHPSKSIFARIYEWIQELLHPVFTQAKGVGIPSYLVWIFLAILVLAALWIFVGVPLRRNRARSLPTGTVFTSEIASPADYRRRAQAARDQSDWNSAVVAQFRAIIASLIERTLLDDAPGRTAQEALQAVITRLPQSAAQLQWAADTFDAVEYGNHQADAATDAAMQDLDTAITKTRITL